MPRLADESPNRITLLRDGDGDGVAETRHILIDGLNQPFGMAMLEGALYIGNTDGLVEYPYADGDTRIAAAGRHWRPSSRADTGHAPSWHRPTASDSISASDRSPISLTKAWRRR